MIGLINNVPFLNKINELEGQACRLTFIPGMVQKWLYENIILRKFNHFPTNLMMPYIHVTFHNPDTQRGPESHPIHYDYGRKYAFNYLLNTGGEDVWTCWYDSDKKLIEKHKIEPFRWHAIAVNPELHAVQGIEKDKKRIFISLNWDPPIDKSKFNFLEYWKNYIE